MPPRTPLLALTLLPALATPAFTAAPPQHPTADHIARWVRQLGAEDFETREAATKRLRAAGKPAESALEKATRSPDRETALRARRILHDFKWGIYPDTPRAVVELIRAYQSASRSEKGAIIKKLFAAGAPGCRALAKVAEAEDDPLVRKDVFTTIAREMSQGVPALLAEDNRHALEGLLEIGLAGDVRGTAANYCAYYLLSGKLDARIRHWEELRRRHPTGKPQAEVLAYLYRARGDLSAARKAAEDADRPDLVEAFLFESADWKELAKRPELISTTDPIEKLATLAAYQRLSGNVKSAEKVLAGIKADGLKLVEARSNVLPSAKALFVNDRPADAVELLVRSGHNRKVAFEALAAQFRFREALALVDKVREAGGPDLGTLEVLRARSLYRLGEKEKALALFKRYTEQIKPGTDAAWFEDLVDALARLGLNDRADDAAARALAASKDLGWGWRLFRKLYPDREDDAEALWNLLRSRGGEETPLQSMKRLRALMEGKARAKEVAGLVKSAEANAKGLKPEEVGRLWAALGEAARACGQSAKARECFEKGKTPLALVRLGDLLAGKREWDRAADAYLKAHREAVKAQSREDTPPLAPPPLGARARSRAEPDEEAGPALALYLSGWALVKGGKVEAGKKRMEQAHWLPLGNAQARSELARALTKRGHVAAARRENEFLLRVGEPSLPEADSFYTAEAIRALAVESAVRKEWRKAARGYQQAVFRAIKPSVNFVNPGSYVGVPAFIHRMRARGFLESGKLAEAKAEAGRCLADLPGDVELVIQVVPELETRGEKKDAARLFEEAFAVYETLTRDYPKASWAHNSAAWLAACCRRELGKGLAHARKAVALEPERAGYHDTLAEVYFQMGKKDEAVAAQKKAVALEPRRGYYRKQLKRMQAGDPKAPRPAEDEE